MRGRLRRNPQFLTVHIIHGSIPSETSPMWKPTTGEPCAGKPPARFGGRGGESLPYPYQCRGPHFERRGPLMYDVGEGDDGAQDDDRLEADGAEHPFDDF